MSGRVEFTPDPMARRRLRWDRLRILVAFAALVTLAVVACLDNPAQVNLYLLILAATMWLASLVLAARPA